MFSLESPYRGDSNAYTQHTIFIITLNYLKSAAMGFFSWGLKKEFETAMVNKALVFKPMKFYCIFWFRHLKIIYNMVVIYCIDVGQD